MWQSLGKTHQPPHSCSLARKDLKPQRQARLHRAAWLGALPVGLLGLPPEGEAWAHCGGPTVVAPAGSSPGGQLLLDMRPRSLFPVSWVS